MGKRASTFRETDVKRAIKAVQAAGLAIGGIEITKEGTIRIVHATGVQESKPVSLKEWLEKNAR